MAFGDLKGTFGVALNSAATSCVATGSATSVVTGDLVYAVFAQQTALTVSAVADNLGHNYTATNVGTDAGSITGRAFYTRVTANGSLTSLTGTAVSSANNIAFAVAAFSGPFTDPAIDANPANSTAGSSGTSYTAPATGDRTNSIELVVSWIARGAGTAFTATSPNLEATQLATETVGRVIIGYQTTINTSSFAPVFTSATTAGVRVLGVNSFMFQPDTRTVRTPSSYKYQTPDWSAAFAALSYRNIACLAVTGLPAGQQLLELPPRPAPRPVTLLTHTDSFKLPLQQVLPNNQIDRPNPIRDQRRGLPDWQDYILPWAQAPPNRLNDWPIPRAPRPLVQDWTQAGNALTYVAPPTVNPGFNEWFNPLGYSGIVRDWIAPTNIALSVAPVVAAIINQTDWPNPRSARRNPQDWRDSFKLPLQQVLPCRQVDWPNPRGPVRNSQDWSQATATFLTIPPSFPPIRQYDWPVPQAPRRNPQDWQDWFNLPLQQVLPPHQTDWPNPRGARPLVQDWIAASDIALLTAIALDTRAIRAPNSYRYQAPLHNLQDWIQSSNLVSFPILVVYPGFNEWFVPTGPRHNQPISLLTHTDSFKLPLQQDYPFNQYDWPVPKAPSINPPYWTNTSLRSAQIQSCNQYDWPVPKAPRRNPQDWHDSFKLPLQQVLPFSQTNWPVPKAPVSAITQLTWTDSFKLGLQSVLPPNQYNWPNPVLAKRNPPDWSYNLYPTLLPPETDITLPQYDWPNPRGQRWPVELLTWTQRLTVGYFLWRPFNRFRTWEISPYAAINSQPWGGLNPNLVEPAPKPFALNDWPNPRGPIYPPLQHDDQVKLLFGPQIYQSDWPVPRGYIPLPAGSVQAMPLPLASPFTPQIAQYDWPNPRGPQPLLQDWQALFPLSQQEVQPRNQYDWLVPKTKASLLWTWTDSFKLPLQQQLPPRQTDWPVPRGPRTNDLRGWTARISLPAITPVLPTSFQNYDWPVPRGPTTIIALRYYTISTPVTPPIPPVYDQNLTLQNEIARVRYLSNRSGRIRYLTNEVRRNRHLTKS